MIARDRLAEAVIGMNQGTEQLGRQDGAGHEDR